MRHPSDVLAGDGRVRVLSRRCKTCVTRKGNPYGPRSTADGCTAAGIATARLSLPMT